MPPEPLPWDRKEYAFKDHKKNERGDALGGGGGGGGSSSASRWRDPYHGPRDLPRASPRRPLSGNLQPCFVADLGHLGQILCFLCVLLAFLPFPS